MCYHECVEERVKSYAKINIGLRIGEKRCDGYHSIDSFFHLVGLFDDISFSFSDAKKTQVFITRSNDYLSGKEDIMEKAALAFSRKTGKAFSFSIDIKKRIPSRAGLGGGSSNAGAVLTFLNRCCGNILSQEELIALSATVGSDVPFFTSGYKAARVNGRGEIVKEAEPLCEKVDLYFPSFSVETAKAYETLDAKERSFAPLPPSLKSIKSDDFPNDFEIVFPRPDIIKTISTNYSYFSLSGSGSTYFGLFRKTDTPVPDTGNIQTISTFLIS